MVRLTIPAQLCFKDLAYAAVLAAIDAEGPGPDAEGRDQIVSALGEAINNVVLHAYRGIRGGNIELDVVAVAGEVEIRILDRGRGFEPDAVPEYQPPPGGDAWDADVELDPGALPESGMGIFIMRSFMDEVTYARGGGGRPNVLVLRKRWPARQSLPSGGLHAGPSAAFEDATATKKETSQSGWRMRSVAVPVERTAGSLRRK